MTPDEDLNATQWLAVAATLLMLLVPVAVALAAWFKRRYAEAIVRLQAETSVEVAAVVDSAAPAPTPAARPSVPALRIELTQATDWPDTIDATRPARRLRRRVLTVQFISGLIYWIALLLCVTLALALLAQLTGETMGDESEDGPTLSGHLFLWPLLLLPAALAWAFQAGWQESRVWAGAAIVMALFGLGVIGLGAGWAAGMAIVGACVLLTLMLVAFMRPAVRGAGPPLVAALTVGLLVFCIVTAVIATFDDSADDSAISAAEWAGAILILLGVLALSGWAAWRMLLHLARRYEARRFSELQLALGAYWALITAYTIGLVMLLSFEGRTGAIMQWVGLAILLLWLGWRALQRVALWLARRRAPAALGALLMLRVFKPSSRSEGFTDRFLARWRFAAPVWMIAGPDLAGAYMEPDEFFAYLSGGLRERFIASPAQVDARVDALDDQRDPDARFRVGELFCANTSWKPAVQLLIDRAGVVLLDLREYTRHRAGTRFELEELLRRDVLHKLLVIVDGRADLAELQTEIRTIWSEVAPAGEAATLHLIGLVDGGDTEMQGLFRASAEFALASTRASN